MPALPTVIEIIDDSDNDAPQVSVGEWKRRLFEYLNSIQEIGGIATFKRYPSFINPGLKVEGNPIVPLPLNEQAALAIKGLCRRASGDGSSANNTWQFEPTQFQLTNPAWPGFLQTVASDVAKTLDIGGVSSVPRHLTLYGPGPISKQDSPGENTTDIIGTLVVFLPSEHQGANVSLSIETMSFCYSPASSSALDVSVISWLQDVKCEVDDLMSGYRLAITYDLWRTGPTHSGPHAGQVIQSSMIHAREILGAWTSNFPGIDKLFFPLVKDNPASLEEEEGHDKTVCRFLRDICPKVGCYFLLAQVTHEITEDCGTVSNVTHTIDEVYTPDGLDLPISGSFSAKKEVLGFSQDDLEYRDADSDDAEDLPMEWACEEGEYARRCHDRAALIIPRDRIVDLVDCRKRVGYSGDTTFRHEEVENLINMLTADMERFVDDPKTRQALLDMMAKLSGTGEILRAGAVERIIELSLESGDTALYNKTLAATSFATSSDSTRVAKLLEQYLIKEYLDKEVTVNWNDWLGPLTGRAFQDFRQSCACLKVNIENEALSQSLDAWMLDTLDLKMETEQKWDSHDCSLALDWIRVRSEKPDWILNRFLPNIAAHASRLFLFNLLRSLWLQNNTPGFLNVTAMCRSIIQHGFEKLIIRIKDFGYSGGTPEPVLAPFVKCIEDCHIGGLSEEALRLLAATSAGLAKSRNSWPRNYGRSRAIMEGLVIPLAGLVERGSAVLVPEFGELVELLVLDFINTTMPLFPAEPDGWTYDARGCPCSDCWELKRFLTSPVMQTWEFPAAEKRRKHIEQILSGDGFSFRLETTRNRSPFTLVVTKTGGEHQLKVKKWQDAYQQLNKLVTPFRSEAMRGCLGDEKYRDLILLEGYAQQAAPVGVAGVRRQATWDEPEPQRRRVM
ncbi:hypothetical protein N0V84_010361 [Fusarium piperis]|uniref:Uncharacterized protein n=1 Tax=Fusarium piperis TaxID=1435070 RepID=A0A9W8TFF4_9HYPO|nr:hypothetical protein N0V84_010361 [Fusarium piperis]